MSHTKCLCAECEDERRDAARYRFLRMPEPEMTEAQEEASAQMWRKIQLKGYWGAKMDTAVDTALGSGPAL